MEQFEKLLAVEPANRDEAWESSFQEAFTQAKVKIDFPEPKEGPDHWPYLLVSTGPEADEPVVSVLNWLSTRGIGLALNAQKSAPDYVFSYGMIWNFRERGQFLSPQESALENKSQKTPESGRFELKHGQEVLTGSPSESYLPKYVRSVIKQFLMDQGVFTPKVLMVSVDHKNYDLCFSIESLKSPPAHEHANIAEALSWFLPAHYTVSLVSEKTVAGFQAL